MYIFKLRVCQVGIGTYHHDGSSSAQKNAIHANSLTLHHVLDTLVVVSAPEFSNSALYTHDTSYIIYVCLIVCKFMSRAMSAPWLIVSTFVYVQNSFHTFTFLRTPQPGKVYNIREQPRAHRICARIRVRAHFLTIFMRWVSASRTVVHVTYLSSYS